ncbi:tetratricopeptide repeat protein [Nocardia sp. CDC153]|uniref:tetratricopeptide repeat protein n=1 Tax=Nocardia sp. CDC153 TaxID=3112167 RepID=UPI002DBBF5AE|nr:tetratricopeptide repeat protein [Nocardia sp. CDC153]MEC3957516.1 tetratricopeptide repeat protein [Nocardia sp. CDC153]
MQRSRVAVIVTGMRGVGKTQLAAALARHDCDTGTGLVGWVDAETIDITRAGLAAIAERLGVADPEGDSAASAHRLRDHLSGHAEPGLLILDNASDPEQIRPLLPSAGGTRVVITTTNRDFAALGELVDLGGYTRAESVAYLNAATGLDDEVGAEKVADSIGDLPLALAAAAATITGRRLDYANYQTLLNSQELPEALARKTGHDYPRSVVQAILLSINTVETRTVNRDLDKVVVWLLGVVAMLSPAGVRRAILPDETGLLSQALERCVTGSLLTWSSNGDAVIMHRLISRVLRERAQSTGQTKRRPFLLRLLPNRIHPAGTSNDLVAHAIDVIEPLLFDRELAWAQREEGTDLVDQIDAIWNTRLPEKSCDALRKRVLQLRSWSIVQLDFSADLARAMSAGAESLADCERVLGPNHIDTLATRNNLAHAYASAGRFDDAIPLYEATLADRKQVLGPNHIDTLATRNNLASAYESAGRLGDAITLLEATLADLERVLEPNHIDTLATRNNLATAYESAGRFDDAITLYEVNLADFGRILGSDHRNTLTSRNNLASAYTSAGRFDDAITLFEATLTDRKRNLGSDHPATLTTRNNLATAYESAGRFDDAITLFEATLTDFERILGSDNPATLTSRNNLAQAYRSAGRLDDAITLCEANLADFGRILGSDNPVTLTTRNNLATAYESAGRFDDAITLFEATLTDRKRILGSDHPDTLTTRNNLAYTYASAGRLDDAIILYEATLADIERILGSDHRNTLTSRNNLATAYASAGRLDDAITLYEATLADRKRILGSDHIDTLASRTNLAYAYTSAGRLDDAITLYEATLADRKRILGSDHPATLTTRNSLAQAYEAVGQLDRAALVKQVSRE